MDALELEEDRRFWRTIVIAEGSLNTTRHDDDDDYDHHHRHNAMMTISKLSTSSLPTVHVYATPCLLTPEKMFMGTHRRSCTDS